MKKLTSTLIACIFALLLMTPSVLAIYTGEEQQEPVEGEYQIMESVEVIKKDLPETNEKTNIENDPIAIIDQPVNLVEPVKETQFPFLYVIGGFVVALGACIVLLKRKK